MKKKDWNFGLWCRIATGKIRYKPDRKAVSAELLGHLEDAYDAYIAKGMTPDEAEAKALETMGRAEDIAPQLAAIHKPFWGFVLRASQILLVLLLVLSLIPIRKYVNKLDLQDKLTHRDFDVYDAASYAGDTGRTLHHLSHPDTAFSSDGNTFTLTDAALFTEYSEYYQKDMTRLYLLVRQTSILPWEEHAEYHDHYPVISYFFVRDAEGNEYPISTNRSRTAGGSRSGIFSYTHECWINDFPSDTEWAELCYVRDGRNFALRVDLTGGDGK